MATTTGRNTRRGPSRHFVRLTGLFRMRSGRGYAGSLRPQDLDNLAAVVKEARSAGKGLAFFAWRNDGGGPSMSLSVAISRDPEYADDDREVRRRPIDPGRRPSRREEPDDEPFPERDDSLFEDEDRGR